MQAASSTRPAPAAWDDEAALRALLGSLAQESGELAQCADRLQDLFGRILGRLAAAPPDVLEQAQALDALVQRLEGLQSFLAGLSTRPLADLTTDAALVANGLKLTSQARRFGSPGRSGAPDPGGCDIF